MKKVFFLTIIFLQSVVSLGQSVDSIESILVSGYINNNKILLRWAPRNFSDWTRGNQYGYSVYRYCVIKNDKIVDKPDTIFLGSFKPFPLNMWENFSDSSTFAIAAEAIFSNEFEVTTSGKNFIDLVNKSREQDNRFSMGLLCADQSFTVACMMGLGLVDSIVKANEAYAYRVVLNYKDSITKQGNGYAFIDFKTGNFTPRPFGINSRVSNKQITLLIPYEPFKGIYSNFVLERSKNNIDFQTIVGKNYYSLSTTNEDPEYNIYIDSIELESPMYYYRVRGRTPFDTYGPYSDTLVVKFMPTITAPWITDLKEVNDKIFLSWDIQKESTENLNGFMVYSSKDKKGFYNALYKEELDKNQRDILLDKPQNFLYYKIAAVDIFDRKYFSSPRLFQASDSIPPSPPKGFQGIFDSSGIVNFNWNYGKESDLLGYQLYYSADKRAEYSLISKSVIYDSTYSAKFPLNSLCSKLYFKVVALDTRYNTSKSSDTIKLVKPDTIPPSPPVIVIKTDSLGAKFVHVAPSNSKDISQHSLCFVPDTNNLVNIKFFEGTISEDTLIPLTKTEINGQLYCVAEDLSKRRSFSNRVLILANNANPKDKFLITAKPSIDEGVVVFSWEKKTLSGAMFIYRRDEKNGYSLIATVNLAKGEFIDKNVEFNTNYNYKLVLKDETGSFISKRYEIQFK